MAHNVQDYFQHKTIKSEEYLGRCNKDIDAMLASRCYRHLSFTDGPDRANAGGRGGRYHMSLCPW
eukprot:12914601-Prorocentrum_lima.AAC.1